MPVQKRCSLPNVVTCFCRKSKTGYASLSCTQRTGSLQTSYGSIRRECLSLFQLLFLLGDEDLGQTSGDKRRKGSVLEIKESGKIGPRKQNRFIYLVGGDERCQRGVEADLSLWSPPPARPRGDTVWLKLLWDTDIPSPANSLAVCLRSVFHRERACQTVFG